VAGLKHFLDTSVARAMLTGSAPYKSYLRKEMAEGRCYGSAFIRMELNRSFISNLIDFYFFASIETFPTMGDAFAAWANRFQKGDLKAIVQIFGPILNTQGLAASMAKDKENALLALACLIKRLELKARKHLFIDIGKDSVHCARAKPSLTGNAENVRDLFKKFSESFGDVEACRKACCIDELVLKKYRSQIELLIATAKTVKRNKETEGFHKIVEELQNILDKGNPVCTCRLCGSIGDTVIALEAPRDMQLEHTDFSFDSLCPPINQPHRRLKSETAVVSPIR
jgi:hypothetical protein